MPPETPPVILIVDDAAENLLVLSDLLRPQYKVLAATNGEGCLRVAHGPLRPELILLDVMMPGMDGYEVLTRLRDDPLTADIPVIFLTGLVKRDEAAEGGGFIAGHPFIAKPFDQAQLTEMIDRVTT